MSNFNTLTHVSVILVTWNNSAHLAKCLDCLVAQTNKDFEIIIVDNGSTDGSISGLKNSWAQLNLRIERLPSNLGFAVANNIGARLARGNHVAL